MEPNYKSIIDFDNNNELPLTEKVTKLYNSFYKLSSHQQDFDFEDIPYNGLRTFLFYVDAFIAKCSQQQKRRNFTKIAQHYDNVAQLLLAMSELFEYHVLKDRELSAEEIVDKLTAMTATRARSLVKLRLFLPSDIAKQLAPMGYAIAISQKRRRGFFSRRLREQLTGWLMAEGNIREFKKTFNLTTGKFMTRICAMRYPVDVYKEAIVNIHSKQQLQEDGSIVTHSCAIENPVQIQILKCHGDKFSDVLLFHIHGGGWCTSSPRTAQAYLRTIAQQLPGATIIRWRQ